MNAITPVSTNVSRWFPAAPTHSPAQAKVEIKTRFTQVGRCHRAGAKLVSCPSLPGSPIFYKRTGRV